MTRRDERESWEITKSKPNYERDFSSPAIRKTIRKTGTALDVPILNTHFTNSPNQRLVVPKSRPKINIVIPTNRKARYSHLDPGKKIMPSEHIDEPIIYSNDHRMHNAKLGIKKRKALLSLKLILTDPPHSVCNHPGGTYL